MSALLALASLLSAAHAAPMIITLDSGGTVRGELAWYEYGGDCQISVTEGELTGSILVVPCDRLTRLERAASAPATEAPALVVAEAPAAPVEPTPAEPATAEPAPLEAAQVDAAPAAEAAVVAEAAFAPVQPTAMTEESPEAATLGSAAVAEAPAAPAATAAAPVLPPLETVAGLDLPADPSAGVPLDNRVSVDPALMGERPDGRVPSAPRPPTSRVPPGSTGATVGW